MSGCLLQRIGLPPSCRKRAAAFMHHALLDDIAAPFKGGAKAVVCGRFLGVNPNDQHPIRTQEFSKPIQRRFEVVKCAAPPVDESDVILTGRRPQFVVAAAQG